MRGIEANIHLPQSGIVISPPGIKMKPVTDPGDSSMPSSIDHFLTSLHRRAARQGLSLYVVGGTPRDRLLGKVCADFDFTLQGAKDLAREFASEHRLPAVILDDTPGRETCRVILSPAISLDFTEMQGDSIESDLEQRDFTINAMAWPFTDFIAGTQRIIDPFGGRADLQGKLVRQVSSAALSADPLRMLRAFRFAALLNFSIHPDTLVTIENNPGSIVRAAGERIHHELLLFLATDVVFPLLKTMAETGLLPALFPEAAEDLNGILRTFANLEDRLKLSASPVGAGLADREKVLLKCATLLTRCPAGGAAAPPRRKAARMESAALKRLRMSNADAGFILAALAVRRGALDAGLAFAQEHGDEGGLYRFVHESGEALEAGLTLALAEDKAGQEGLLPAAVRVLEFYRDRYLPAQQQPPLLSGIDLRKKFRLPPSPLFRVLLAEVEEGRVLGTLKTTGDAETHVRRRLEAVERS